VAATATAFAPGRVNLIGEHTDYNDGLALPFAIREGVTVRAVASGTDSIHVTAEDLGAHDTFDLGAPGGIVSTPGWRAFARGAVAELTRDGAQLVGARLNVTGTVPRGSGLSSSAALEVALCLALLAVARSPVPDPLRLAQICSRVENDWVGARTGLLDQLSSLCGEPERALRIDFRSLQVTPVALQLAGWTLVTLDSGESHANAGHGPAAPAGDYNTRRDECGRAREALGLVSLRDATPELAAGLPWPLRGRVEHLIGETCFRSPPRRSRRRSRACGRRARPARGSSAGASAATCSDCSRPGSCRRPAR
jgi:galactokinase